MRWQPKVVLSVREQPEELELADLRAEFGYPVPGDYLEFLARFGGARCADNEFVVPESGQSCGIDEFFTVAELREWRSVYADRLPTQVLAIASAEGGNLLCLDLRQGQILFFDHELEEEGNSAAALSLVATTLQEFLVRKLMPFDPDSVELDPSDVESVWVSPELLERLKSE